MSERVKANKLLSEASYLASLYQFRRGNLQNALHHAKGCVCLNQRNWVNLESRERSNRQLILKSQNEINFAQSGEDRETAGAVAASMALESLNGAAFWALVPSLVRCFSHLADILIHQGLFQESVHYLERAEKIACTVDADSYVLSTISNLALLYVRGNRPDKARLCIEKATAISGRTQPSAVLANYYLSVAHLYRIERRFTEEMNVLELATNTLNNLKANPSATVTDENSSGVDPITELLSNMALGNKSGTEKKPISARRGTRTRKEGTTTVVRKPQKQTRGATAKEQDIAPGTGSTEWAYLDGLYGSVQREKALCLLRQGKHEEAFVCLSRADDDACDFQANIEQKLSWFRKLLAQGMRELASDFTFNCLPESTISFPATRLSARSSATLNQGRKITMSPRRVTVVKNSSSPRESNAVIGAKRHFADTLMQARECLGEVYVTALSKCSTWLMHQIYKSMSQITVLLSAASSGTPKSVFQPCSVAFSLGTASCPFM